MQCLRHIWLGFCLAAFLLQAFTFPLIFATFQLNREYIAANLCENRAVPESNCDGQCVLMKKLKKAQQDEQAPDKGQSKKEQAWQYYAGITGKAYFLPLLRELQAAYLPAHCPSLYLTPVFHPPRTGSVA